MALNMAVGVTGPWDKEDHLPAEHFLYMRVLKDDIDDEGWPEPRIFRNHTDEHGVAAMSTDWSKYCNPEGTQLRARRRSPSDYGVISLGVGEVLTIPHQAVSHAPIFNRPENPQDPNNRAHTNVLGPKSKKDPYGSVEIRARYIAIVRVIGWAVKPPSK